MKKPSMKIFLADPPGSILYSYIKSGGELSERSGNSITEGIGQGRITQNLGGDLSLIGNDICFVESKVDC